MNILLVGEESASVQALKLLAAGARHLVGLMASPTRKAIGGVTVWRRAENLGRLTMRSEGNFGMRLIIMDQRMENKNDVPERCATSDHQDIF